jgi:hypothetical protein
MSQLKIITIIAILLSISFNIYSQDIITFKSGDELEAKVLDIKEDVISYKKWDNLEGPTYTTSKQKVFMIKYINGTKDIFSQESTSKSNNKVLTDDEGSTPSVKESISSSSSIKVNKASQIEKLYLLRASRVKKGIASSIFGPIFLFGGVAMMQYNSEYTPDENYLLIGGGASAVLSVFILASIPYHFVKAGKYSSEINRINSNVRISPTLINNVALGKSNPSLGLRISVSF